MIDARAVVAGACALALASTACTRAMFVPPVGPGTPVTDAAAAWTEATTACRSARTYTGALRLSGRAGDQRLWPVSLESAVTSDNAVYLSATVAGRSIFVLAGTAQQAGLWLRADRRVVTARPSEIVEAMIGVALEPRRWLAVLSGCVTGEAEVESAERHGKLLTIRTRDARVHLARQGASWRTVAGEADGFVVEFGWGASQFPKEIWIWSAPGRAPASSLHVSVRDSAINTDVPPAIFRLPAGAAAAVPMSLDELRAAGPLRARRP